MLKSNFDNVCFWVKSLYNKRVNCASVFAQLRLDDRREVMEKLVIIIELLTTYSHCRQEYVEYMLLFLFMTGALAFLCAEAAYEWKYKKKISKKRLLPIMFYL